MCNSGVNWLQPVLLGCSTLPTEYNSTVHFASKSSYASLACDIL